MRQDQGRPQWTGNIRNTTPNRKPLLKNWFISHIYIENDTCPDLIETVKI